MYAENLIITNENNIKVEESQFMQIDLPLLALVQLCRFVSFLLALFSANHRD